MNKRLVRFLINSILAYDAEYEVEETIREDGATLIKIKVEPKYVGRLIGKDGRTAKAINTLLSLDNSNVFLEISEI